MAHPNVFIFTVIDTFVQDLRLEVLTASPGMEADSAYKDLRF